MSPELLTKYLYQDLCAIPFVDVHTHLDPRQPAARNLDELLSYRPCMELALATGMEKTMLGANVDPRDRARAVLYQMFDFFPNTTVCQWFVEIVRLFLGSERLHFTLADFTPLWNASERAMAQPDWEDRLFQQTNVTQVFVDCGFDDQLEGLKLRRYVPCMRVDELVFHLDRTSVQQRLAQVTGVGVRDVPSLCGTLAVLFEQFSRHGVKAITLVLPGDFVPAPVLDADLSHALNTVLSAEATGVTVEDDVRVCCSQGIFRTLLGHCRSFQLPLHLMIGSSLMTPKPPDRRGGGRYNTPVHYADLAQDFPEVTFCITILDSGTNPDLLHLAQLFPNVVIAGHGGRANFTPALLREATRVRLQTIPQTKLIGYFSNMNKLEFCLPQFNMYRRALAQALAEEFVLPGLLTMDQAGQLGRLLLCDNARRIFEV
jgi:glucuronate isomerase